MLGGAFDVAFIDYDLGQETGARFLEEIGGRSGQTVPILVTGLSDRSVQGVALEAGAVAIINKADMTPLLLETTIRTALHTRDIELRLCEMITECERREEQIKTLLKEVNHRAKNLLGVVQAIAWQTKSDGSEEFVSRFSERLHALAANQDLLIRSQWRAIDMQDLVRAQLSPFSDGLGSRVVLQGPKLPVTARSAQLLAMALHELATNASKFGALSNDQGTVMIDWRVDAGPDGHESFCLSWVERGGPEVRTPGRRGFGTTVLEDMPKMQLAATATVEHAPTGISWKLMCPIARIIES